MDAVQAAILSLAALVAGGIASVAGFGIGSVLTPALSAFAPAKLAVAAVSIPHLLATAHRLWLIREHIDRGVLRSFGLMSAAGGLTGALIGTMFTSRGLETLLALLMAFVGAGVLAGWNKRFRFSGTWAWLAGGLSGLLGGLVGNQGGIRSGAMMGLGVSRDAFVATATATGVLVDLARMPVYATAYGKDLVALWPQISLMTAGALLGTVAGIRLLRRIPEDRFYAVVSILLLALSAWLLAKGWLV